MPTQKIVNEHKQLMEKALEFLHSEFKTVRTGRASTGLVENLKVDYYGSPTPLKQLATFSVPESSMIVIKPFDPASIKEIEKAIKNSDLSIAPMSDGKLSGLTSRRCPAKEELSLPRRLSSSANRQRSASGTSEETQIKNSMMPKRQKLLPKTTATTAKKKSTNLLNNIQTKSIRP